MYVCLLFFGGEEGKKKKAIKFYTNYINKISELQKT